MRPRDYELLVQEETRVHQEFAAVVQRAERGEQLSRSDLWNEFAKFPEPKGAKVYTALPPGLGGLHLAALVPLYDLVFYTITGMTYDGDQIRDGDVFRGEHGWTAEGIVKLTELGRIVPILHWTAFKAPYTADLIARLKAEGVPYLASDVVNILGVAKQVELGVYLPTIKAPKKDYPYLGSYADSVAVNDRIRRMRDILELLIRARALESTWATREPSGLEVIRRAAEGLRVKVKNRVDQYVVDRELALTLLERLHVAYSPEIPVEEYVKIFDSATTKAVRRAVSDIIKKDEASGDISRTIGEYNRMVRTARRRSTILRSSGQFIRKGALPVAGLVAGYLGLSPIELPQVAEGLVGAGVGGGLRIALDSLKSVRAAEEKLIEKVGEYVMPAMARLVGVSPEAYHLCTARDEIEALQKKARSAGGEKK